MDTIFTGRGIADRTGSLSLTWSGLCTYLQSPTTCDSKDELQWFIPSLLPRRTFARQRAVGQFCWLWADFDKPGHTLYNVYQVAHNLFGDTGWCIYSTFSSTPELRKYRLVIPFVGTRIPGHYYEAFQHALNDALRDKGLNPDSVNQRPGQLVYLPAHSEHYEYYIHQHPVTDGRLNMPLADAARDIQQKIEEDRARKEQARGLKKIEGDASHHRAFRYSHPTRWILEQCGFTSYNGIDWHYDQQGTQSYATRLHDDGSVYTLSETVGLALGGHRLGNGYYFHDGYYILMKRQGWSSEQMEAYAKQFIGAHLAGWTAELFSMQIWTELQAQNLDIVERLTEQKRQAVQAYHIEATAEANIVIEQLSKLSPTDEGSESECEWPPGVIGLIAKDIYDCSYIKVKTYSVLMAFFLMSCAQKRYSLENAMVRSDYDAETLNLFMFLVGPSGTGKGRTYKSAEAYLRHVEHKYSRPDPQFGRQAPMSPEGLHAELSIQNPVSARMVDFGSKLDETSKDRTGRMSNMWSRITEVFDSSEIGVSTSADSKRTREAVKSPKYSFYADLQTEAYKKFLSNEDAFNVGIHARLITAYHTKGRALAEDDEVVEHNTELLDWYADFSNHCQSNDWQDPQLVTWTTDASFYMKKFARDLYNRYNADVEEGSLEHKLNLIYNRRALNASRIAALLAIGRNYHNPVICQDDVLYALDMLQGLAKPVASMVTKGTFGSGSKPGARKACLVECVRTFVHMAESTLMSRYKVNKRLAGNDRTIIPLKFFLRRCEERFHPVFVSEYGSGPDMETNVMVALKHMATAELIETVDEDELAALEIKTRRAAVHYRVKDDLLSMLRD